MKKVIGIEIGNDTLKMAVVNGGNVDKMAYERLPDNLIREGKVVAATAMTNFLKETMKKNQIRPGPCAFVIPTQAVIGHHVTMPMMSPDELKLNLPFEFRDFVGKDGEKYEYDYSVVSTDNGKLELYAAAVAKDVLESYATIFKKAGLSMKIAVPKEMAWLNLIRRAKNAPDTLCIVDVGHMNTHVDVFKNGNYVMGRDIDRGGMLLDEAIADNMQVDIYAARVRKEANYESVQTSETCINAYVGLAVEVMKIVSYYNYSSQGRDENSSLSDIYFCGGSARIEALRIAILKSTGLTMHHIKRFFDDKGDENSDVYLVCALAASAALQSEK